MEASSAAATMLPMLIAHVTAGAFAIVAGYTAILAPKGERVHRIAGTVFLISMLVMAAMATYMAVALHPVKAQEQANITMALLAAYLVATGWTTIRRREGTTGLFEKFAFAVVLGVGATFLTWGVQAAMTPRGVYDGYPAALYFIFGGVSVLFAAWDVKTILKGGVTGATRIARHLWRMSFGLFIAAGSFFLGQQKVMPLWMKGSPVLYVLALAPLVLMIFWLIRVRFTKWYKSDAGNTGAPEASEARLPG